MPEFAPVPLSALAGLTLALSLPAQDLGGGATASHGRVPRFVLERWEPGGASAFAFADTPAGTLLHWAAISFRAGSFTHPLLQGTLLPATTSSTFQVVAMGARQPIQLLGWLEGVDLFVQGVILDPSSLAFVATDATRVRFHDPLAVAGTRTGRTLEVLDENTAQVVQTLGNSRNGRVHFTPDRTRAYVSQTTNQVRRYGVTSSGLVFQGTIPLTYPVRDGTGDITRDGRRLYLPVQQPASPYPNFIAEIDIDPASPTRDTELRLIPVPVVGTGSGPGNGPTSCAVTPDGQRLYLAHAEVLANPGQASVGMIDLSLPGTPQTVIPVTAGGDLIGIHSMEHIEVSEDGSLVFAIEQGFDPSLPLINGYQAPNGALLTVIDTATNQEIAAIPTEGIGQYEFARDLLDRQLWIGQTDHNRIGQAVCIDIDRRSATRFSILRKVNLDPQPYSAGLSGPLGIAVTPDGSRVVVTLQEDQLHPAPEILTLDARTGAILGRTAIAATRPFTAAVQRY